jgi:hypothetical protein
MDNLFLEGVIPNVEDNTIYQNKLWYMIPIYLNLEQASNERISARVSKT